MKPVIYIHTNDKQFLGAKVAEYSLKSRSKSPDKFDVKLLKLEQTPHLFSRHGKEYLRKGRTAVWNNNDLQSFSPLRMMVPQAMGYQGRALLIDPDVFSVADVNEVLEMDMQEKAILCRHIKGGYKSNGNSFYATSVMLLDCEKLMHWDWDKSLDEMFAHKLDYGDWISLENEPVENIGDLPEEWNHFDTLTEQTKLLHNTERSTQPWKTGLPVDYDSNVKSSFINKVMNICAKKKKYLPHPDKDQELLFLKLVKECLDKGVFDIQYLEYEVKMSNLRKDIFMQLEVL